MKCLVKNVLTDKHTTGENHDRFVFHGYNLECEDKAIFNMNQIRLSTFKIRRAVWWR